MGTGAVETIREALGSIQGETLAVCRSCGYAGPILEAVVWNFDTGGGMPPIEFWECPACRQVGTLEEDDRVCRWVERYLDASQPESGWERPVIGELVSRCRSLRETVLRLSRMSELAIREEYGERLREAWSNAKFWEELEAVFEEQSRPQPTGGGG